MIELTEDHAAELRRLVRAGKDGLLLGDVCTTAAMHMAQFRLVTITNDKTSPQRAIATEQARHFMLRGVS